MKTPTPFSPLQVTVTSYGELHGPLPSDETPDLLVNASRLFRNPHHDPALRQSTGLDPVIRHHVIATPGVSNLIARAADAVHTLVADVGCPQSQVVRVAVNCRGGRHRSVVIASLIAEALIGRGVGVDVEHRDIDKPVITRRPVH